MNLTVRKVIHESEDFTRYLEFRQEIYKKASVNTILPEDVDVDHLIAFYGVEADERLLARAALYKNNDITYQGVNCYLLGNYEAVDESDVAKILLNYIAEEARKLGATLLIGPMNGNTWGTYRFAENTSNPFFLEPFHFAYYRDHFRSAGFHIIKEYCSKISKDISALDLEEVAGIDELMDQEGVVLRPIKLEEFETELEKLYSLVHQAFSQNFLFSSLSKDRFLQKYRSAKEYLNQEYTRIAEDRKGNFIAFFFCFNDYFFRSGRRLIIKTIARHPDKKWRGLGKHMGEIIYNRAKEDGYDAIIHALMDEEASSSSISSDFDCKLMNRYFLYAKTL